MKQYAAAILTVGDHVLLMLRDNKADIPNPNTWCIFGGLAEGDDESPVETMIREVTEETGYHASKHTLLWSELDDKSQTVRWIFEVPVSCDVRDLHCGEGQGLGLFSFQSALNLPLGPYTRRYLERYLHEKIK